MAFTKSLIHKHSSLILFESSIVTTPNLGFALLPITLASSLPVSPLMNKMKKLKKNLGFLQAVERENGHKGGSNVILLMRKNYWPISDTRLNFNSVFRVFVQLNFNFLLF